MITANNPTGTDNTEPKKTTNLDCFRANFLPVYSDFLTPVNALGSKPPESRKLFTWFKERTYPSRTFQCIKLQGIPIFIVLLSKYSQIAFGKAVAFT